MTLLRNLLVSGVWAAALLVAAATPAQSYDVSDSVSGNWDDSYDGSYDDSDEYPGISSGFDDSDEYPGISSGFDDSIDEREEPDLPDSDDTPQLRGPVHSAPSSEQLLPLPPLPSGARLLPGLGTAKPNLRGQAKPVKL
ncbi:hypothetical protein BBJ28_00022356 [Nothophytophthora sp. Chile5]|nr:hypothetical protein BBJ28_00022356 [Nothophytophthora sp. Chile5]